MLKKRTLYSIMLFMTGVLLITGISGKLATGGRWGIGIPTAMADHFLNGQGLYYATPVIDECSAGAFYFPGVVFLTIPIRAIFGSATETVMIVLAWILIVAGLYLFAYISTRLVVSGGGYDVHLGCIMAAVILFFQFTRLKYYAGEWHPDYLAVICAMAACLFLDKIIGTYQVTYHIGYILSLILCGISKQVGVVFYFALAVYILFGISLSLKRKMILLSEMFISGLVVLGIIFVIPGCYTATVYTMSKHPLVDFHDVLTYCREAVKECWFFLLFFILYFVKWIVYKSRKNTSPSDHIARMWFICACFWFVTALVGSFKYGSNSGNIEAAAIVFMPYAICAMAELFCIVMESRIKMVRYAAVVLAASGMLYVLVLTVKQIPGNLTGYTDRLKQQQAITEYLNEHYLGKVIAYNSGSYFYVCDADVNLATDTYLLHHYLDADMIDNDYFRKLEEEKDWDLIMWVKKWDNEDGLIISDNYELEELDEFASLGRIYVKKQ